MYIAYQSAEDIDGFKSKVSGNMSSWKKIFSFLGTSKRIGTTDPDGVSFNTFCRQK